jgi:hypothetical protein
MVPSSARGKVLSIKAFISEETFPNEVGHPMITILLFSRVLLLATGNEEISS